MTDKTEETPADGEQPKKSRRKVVAEEGSAPMPPLPRELKTASDKERVKIWAQQEKLGTITLCGYEQGKGKDGQPRRCYFPVNPIRDPAQNNDPKIVTVGEGEDARKAILAECSFAGVEHGERHIFPKKKTDEI